MNDSAVNMGVRPAIPQRGREYRLFIVAGEHSGDALGAKLMAAISERTRGRVRYLGVGGEGMQRQGLLSQFALEEVAVMGPQAILKRLPRIIRRVYDTAAAGVAADPDAVVIIDAPEFTHPIAKRIRRRRPAIPIIDYVSPSVWAWRSGRARRMRSYIDHVLALLPFEPEAHERLGGPPCTYVGHPLIERFEWLHRLNPAPLSAGLGLDPQKPVLVVLPGSRPSEVERLIAPFEEMVRRILDGGITPEIIMPVVPNLRGHIENAVKAWPIVPHLVESEDEKFAAFRLAHAAVAASGTVTLELAVCGTPAVVAYRVDNLIAPLLRRVIPKNIPSVVLANLVADESIYPELLQENCTGDKLAQAVLPLFLETPERRAQVTKLAAVPQRMMLPDGTPSGHAADVVLRYAEGGRNISAA
jgi:lipid-A-disaccharide synthase